MGSGNGSRSGENILGENYNSLEGGSPLRDESLRSRLSSGELALGRSSSDMSASIEGKEDPPQHI